MHHTQISTSMGVKISAPGLEDAVAGTQLLAAWLQLLGMMGCKHRITSRVFFFFVRLIHPRHPIVSPIVTLGL